MDINKAYNNDFYYRVDSWDCKNCQNNNMSLVKFETRSSLSRSILLEYDNNTEFRIKGVSYLECPDCGNNAVIASGFNPTSEDIHTKDITDLSLQ